MPRIPFPRRHIIPFIQRLLFSGMACSTVACSSLKPSDFAHTRPTFDIMKFYTGHTVSTGLLASAGGKPLKRVATETWGRMAGDELHLTQDVSFDDGKPERRIWQIRRVDEHHYLAQTKNVIGVARGESWGKALRLDYVLALNPANPLTRVRMTHWMTLQPDEKTMLNVVTVRKWGMVLARITEVFQRSSKAAPLH